MLKLVEIKAEGTPETINVPVATPVVALAGMNCPVDGIKLPWNMTPAMAVVLPAGVNVAAVPFGILPPDMLICGRVPVPTTPIIAVPT